MTDLQELPDSLSFVYDIVNKSHKRPSRHGIGHQTVGITVNDSKTDIVSMLMRLRSSPADFVPSGARPSPGGNSV
ncbi:hypothetical protein [Pararhizobium sp. O133]|uniref:hypothetical protein n=1 Tax=Pararhizobium sp. O133 TaxID=3449278 RepID=UPI003F68939F